jgi:hypothetical protein
MITLPKSLIAAIVIGVAASSLLGILFFEVKNSNWSIFGDDYNNLKNSFLVMTDKSSYKIGEPITIDIINSGTSPITLDNPSYSVEIRGLDNVLIYSATFSTSGPDGVDPLISDMMLLPDETITLVWDQIKNDGNLAVQGIYKAYVKATTIDNVTIEGSTNIEIFK